MNGRYLYLPTSVGLADIVQALGSSYEIEDQTHLELPQVVVRGPANIYVNVIEDWDNGGCWPGLPERMFGDFVCIGFESSDFARIAGVVGRVIVVWPALIDDDRDHVFGHEDFAAWLTRHPSPSWADVYAGALLEMPVLETYDCGDSEDPQRAR